jgi:signal recognition particle receptor subunit beta
MSFIRAKTKEINCKIAYFGAPFSGKTTSVRWLREKTSPSKRGQITTLPSSEEHGLLFDFLPLSLGKIKDYEIRIHVYTVPGQVVYDASKLILLKGLDGIVFVADSRLERLEDNLESWKNLRQTLKNHGLNPKTIPMAIQWNKRDVSGALPFEIAKKIIAREGAEAFETVATRGTEILEGFQSVAKQVLKSLN